MRCVEERLVRVEPHLTFVGDRHDAEHGPAFAAEHVPGDDVGVVLENRQDDLVARPDVAPSPGLRHQVDGLGRAAHEDDFARGAGAEVEVDLGAGCLVGIAGAHRQGVGTAVNVRVIGCVEARHRVDDRPRLVRRGGVVQPDERLTVDPLVERREIAAHHVHIVQTAGVWWMGLRISPPRK